MKKILSFLVLALISFFTINNNVNADSIHIATAQKGLIQDDAGRNMFKYKKVGSAESLMQSAYPFTDDSGNIYYCAQPTVSAEGGDYSSGSDFDNLSDGGIKATFNNNELALIMYYGYGYTGRTSYQWYHITQMLVWRSLYPSGELYFTDGKTSKNKVDYYDDEMAAIMSDVDNHSKKTDFGGNLGNIKYGETKSFEDYNHVADNYEVESCSNCNAHIENNTLYVTPTKIEGSFQVNLIQKFNMGNTKTLNLFTFVNETTKQKLINKVDPQDVKISLTGNSIPKTSKIVVDKIDEESVSSSTVDRVAGATICIYKNKNSDPLSCQVSDGINKMNFGPYEKGTYYLRETKAPKGFILNDKWYEVTINGYGEDSNLTITNTKFSTFTLYKKSSEGDELLAGVEIEIYNNDDVLLYRGTTNSKGQIKVGKISAGTYYYKEINTLDGFHKDDTKHYFVINSDGGCFVVETLYNNPTSFELTKTDLSSGDPIANVKFEIYQKQSDNSWKLYYSGLTNQEGKIYLSKLPFGNYYFVEVEVPNPYILNDEKHYFDVTNDNYIIKSQVTNEKYSRIEIKKTDISESEAIEGVTIEIYKITDSGDELIYEGITDKEGMIYYDLLSMGKYYFVETGCPDQYILNTDKHYFEITKDGSVIKSTLINEKYSKVEIKKTDISESEAIEGVTIEIYKMTDNGDELIYKGITDQEGMIYYDYLLKGKYYFIETDCPDLYILNTEKHYFEVLENGSIIKSTLINEKYSKVEIKKTDISESEAIEGVTIEIYKMTDNGDELIYKGITDQEGMIYYDYLLKGKYYFIETDCPDQYILNTEKHYFEVLENGSVIKSTLINEKYSKVEIKKTDISGANAIEGASIEIYKITDSGEELVYKGITDQEGMIYYDYLVKGNYYFIETDCPNNVWLNTDKHYFEITDNGIVYKDSITNELKSYVTFTKRDSLNFDVLDGATICVYTNDGELVKCLDLSSSEENILELKIGNYYYVETKAPNQYELDEEMHYFEITKEGTKLEIDVLNDKIIEVPDTNLSKDNIINIVGLVLAVLGIGYIIYDRKKK